MKDKIGIIKEIDRIGRIVIPKEYRDRYGFHDTIEIVATESGVLIRNPEYVLKKVDDCNNK
ncbi:MAG: hypothetical protein IKC87_06765 [Clostridia bacterium]|nr:hypothetical protein [Clostridia bacterium]